VAATLLGVAMAALGLLVAAASQAHEEAAGRSVILSAFGDKEATYGESRPYLKRLEDMVDRTAESAYCEGVYEGKLSGQPVTVVVTGTGGDNSGPCAQEMLYWYSSGIKEFIWSGIGGATPAVGGLYDGAGKRRAGARPVMIGDVCISPFTWNYDLHFSSVNDFMAGRSPNDRYRPAGGWWNMQDAAGQSKVPGFENVRQFVRAPVELADELLAAAAKESWPTPGEAEAKKIERFFPADQIRPVKFYDYTICAEVSGNDFWHGATEDRLARNYLAGLINGSGFPLKKPASRDNVVVFSAMESAAWMSVVDRWNKHRGVAIPMVVVRSASNYDQVPLTAEGNPIPGPKGEPLTAMQDILIGFKQAGANFAAEMAAKPVLRMFRERRDATAREGLPTKG
jgi:purine nucleoside permease